MARSGRSTAVSAPMSTLIAPIMFIPRACTTDAA